jgi:hypothetical protein
LLPLPPSLAVQGHREDDHTTDGNNPGKVHGDGPESLLRRLGLFGELQATRQKKGGRSPHLGLRASRPGEDGRW